MEDNHRYVFPPEDPHDYRFDVGNEHEHVEDVDPQLFIKLLTFLKRGKEPGPDTMHNEVLRLGITTSLFHHLAKLFTSSIQLGYIPTAWKIATLRMLLKPDKLPSLTTSYRPISLISSIMKLFEKVIEQRLRSHLENMGFLNNYQSGFRRAKSTDDNLFRLSQSMESFNRGELLFLTSKKHLTMFGLSYQGTLHHQPVTTHVILSYFGHISYKIFTFRLIPTKINLSRLATENILKTN